MAVIKDLKYHPNIHARNLASHTSHILGMIVSDIQNPFFPAVIKAFQARAHQRGFQTIVTDTGFSREQMNRATAQMLEQNVRAVAFMTSEMSLSSINAIQAQDIAVTFLDVGLVGQRTSNISLDYYSGIRQVIAHLTKLGHRRIAFVAGPPHLQNVLARQLAYVECMTSAGLEVGPIVPGDMSFGGGHKAGLKIISVRPRPTAVIAVNDFIATGVIKAMHDCGLRVPQDMSVVGFDNTWLAHYFSPSLTSVDVHADMVGRIAADSLLAVSSSQHSRGREYHVAIDLVVRESTAAAPRKAVTRTKG
jgi:DNA-binding LacI/PurR family transcriptional regulator